jgi:O-methyltransferase involved in polyketide biosynthesis
MAKKEFTIRDVVGGNTTEILKDFEAPKGLSPLGVKLEKISRVAFRYPNIAESERVIFYLAQRRVGLSDWMEKYPNEEERMREVRKYYEKFFLKDMLEKDAKAINEWLKTVGWQESGLTPEDLVRIVCCNLKTEQK